MSNLFDYLIIIVLITIAVLLVIKPKLKKSTLILALLLDFVQIFRIAIGMYGEQIILEFGYNSLYFITEIVLKSISIILFLTIIIKRQGTFSEKTGDATMVPDSDS